MNRKAFALSLMTAATAALPACTGEVDDNAAENTAALSSFRVLAPNSACASASTPRQGPHKNTYVRVRFEPDGADRFLTIETYDKTTGRLVDASDYQYRVALNGDLEAFFLDTGNQAYVVYTLRPTSNGAELVYPSHTNAPAVPLACDLRAGAPNLVLPVAQSAAAVKTIPAGQFPTPPERHNEFCTSTKKIDGGILQVRFTKYSWRSPVVTQVLLYDGATHYVRTNLLAGQNALVVDEESKFGIVGGDEGPSQGTRFGSIVAKTIGGKRRLVLVAEAAPLKGELPAEVPLSCELE